MKPLRTGFAAGLLAGGVAAATKLVEERRLGTTERVAVRLRSDAKAALKSGAAAKDGRVTFVERRAARRAAVNRPAWVVAPAPVAAVHSPPSARPLPSGPRKMPSLTPLKQVSAKSVTASVGKFAVKRAGMAIGKVAADRVGKAIEVIETLEKVVAAAQPAARPDPTPAPPIVVAPPAAFFPSAAGGPGVSDTGEETAGEAGVAKARPMGTLVSVRKFERGPRVVVGPSVSPPPTEAIEPTEPVESVEPVEVRDSPAEAVAPAPPVAEVAPVGAAVEAVAQAVEAALDEAAASSESSASSPDAPANAKPRKRAAKRPPATKAPTGEKTALKEPGPKEPGPKEPGPKAVAAKATAPTAKAKRAPSSAKSRPTKKTTADTAAPAPAAEPQP